MIYLKMTWLVLIMVVVLQGCSSWKKNNPEKFTYEEPKPVPFVEPTIIPYSKYIRTSPSGRLTNLSPKQIGIVDLPTFSAGSDARGFISIMAKDSKKAGYPFLPYHYFVTPEGEVLEGLDVEYAGYLARKPQSDTIIVCVMGDFSKPDFHLINPQQERLIQLLAWLCVKNGIGVEQILPGKNINPDCPPLGRNLQNWFGPTNMLRNRVSSTIESQNKEEGYFSSMFKEEPRKTPSISDEF